MPENTLIISFVKRMYKNKTKIKISKKNSTGFLTSDKIYKLNFALCRFSKYSASNSLWWYFATHRNYLTDVLPFFFFGFGCLFFPCQLWHNLVLGSQRFIYITVNGCMNQKWFIETMGISSPYYMYAYMVNILKIFYLKNLYHWFFWVNFQLTLAKWFQRITLKLEK